eukprot:s1630_g5.t1
MKIREFRDSLERWLQEAIVVQKQVEECDSLAIALPCLRTDVEFSVLLFTEDPVEVLENLCREAPESLTDALCLEKGSKLNHSVDPCWKHPRLTSRPLETTAFAASTCAIGSALILTVFSAPHTCTPCSACLRFRGGVSTGPRFGKLTWTDELPAHEHGYAWLIPASVAKATIC